MDGPTDGEAEIQYEQYELLTSNLDPPNDSHKENTSFFT